MQAVANNPKFAKKVGVPTKVGKEFTKETKMKKKVKKYEGGGPLGEAPAAMVRIREGMQKAEEDQRAVDNYRRKQMQEMRERQKMAREMPLPSKPPQARALDMMASPGEAMARAAEGTRRAMEKAGLSPVRGTMAPGMMQRQERPAGMKKGGKVKSKSKTNCRRGDGICKQGKTKGRMV